MRRLHVWCAVLLVFSLSAACGKSEEERAAEKAAEEAQEAADALRKAAESAGSGAAAQGMQEFSKAMEGMASALGGGTGDGKTVEPIAFQQLQTALPELPGWTRENQSGERMTIPVAFSQAEVDYVKGDTTVNVKIVDSAFHQLLIAPWSMFLTSGYEKQTSGGYEKSVLVAGHPGFERWDSSDKDGELNLVINKRFLVTLEGRDLANMDALHDIATRLDTAKLTTTQ